MGKEMRQDLHAALEAIRAGLAGESEASLLEWLLATADVAVKLALDKVRRRDYDKEDYQVILQAAQMAS